MATSEKAAVYMETGHTLNAFTAMTDSGDRKTFTVSGGTVWSNYEGKTPDIRPNGVYSGRNLLSPSATDDKIEYAGFKAYSKGVLHTIAASNVTVTRPATAVAKISSITMTDASAIAVVAGTDGSGQTFSETRGAAGGPPEIPADSVELGQIRTIVSTTGVYTADEIFQNAGQHTEYADYPTYNTNPIGEGDLASVSAKSNAHLEFDTVLPLIHASSTAKRIYIKWYAPVMTLLSKTFGFKAPEKTGSVSSKTYYNGVLATTSMSLAAGGFSAILGNGITDPVVAHANKVVTIKFYPDRNLMPFILCQGLLTTARTFPEAASNEAAITISSEHSSAGFTA